MSFETIDQSPEIQRVVRQQYAPKKNLVHEERPGSVSPAGQDGGNVMRFSLHFRPAWQSPRKYAQTGPCEESAIKPGNLLVADDAFSYMPPYGKPVTGKPAIEEANMNSFSDRTNIKFNWVGEHRMSRPHPATWPMNSAHAHHV
jgi:hypothetical protein